MMMSFFGKELQNNAAIYDKTIGWSPYLCKAGLRFRPENDLRKAGLAGIQKF